MLSDHPASSEEVEAQQWFVTPIPVHVVTRGDQFSREYPMPVRIVKERENPALAGAPRRV